MNFHFLFSLIDTISRQRVSANHYDKVPTTVILSKILVVRHYTVLKAMLFITVIAGEAIPKMIMIDAYHSKQ